ncbi:UBX domain-containing protein 6-like [Cimex lectularius]|uniref:UBX domain-containing protein n=1 Tax=Cimex lectularius TaxID=79782 RepID=A0A8I6S576_CIMLE|nr:UBX domain-containing protein 6-like [Cimex lectularius]
MADKLRNLFSKKKDGKFKGRGQRLNDADSPPEPSPQKVVEPIPREMMTEGQRQAGLAALARLANTPGGSARSAFAYQHGKMEADLGTGAIVDDKLPELLAVLGVYYRCPFIGPEVLSKAEWKEKIKSYLEEQLKVDQALASCLMIHTLNKNREKVSECIEILCTYLNNILSHPDEEKYRKIRKSNRNFSEKVMKIEGALEFLLSAGFKSCSIQSEDTTEEYLLFENEIDASHFEFLMDSLRSAEPIRLELDRNPQVLLANQASKMLDLPSEFYRLTVEELKREQRQRTESLEAASQLRTKAMREKAEQKELRRYQYTLIRIRFPDGLFLQGTFNVYEHFIEVRKYVSDCLEVQVPFDLMTALGKLLTDSDDETSLLDLKLVPAVLLTINIKSSELSGEKSFIKSELLSKMETI